MPAIVVHRSLTRSSYHINKISYIEASHDHRRQEKQPKGYTLSSEKSKHCSTDANEMAVYIGVHHVHYHHHQRHHLTCITADNERTPWACLLHCPSMNKWADVYWLSETQIRCMLLTLFSQPKQKVKQSTAFAVASLVGGRTAQVTPSRGVTPE